MKHKNHLDERNDTCTKTANLRHNSQSVANKCQTNTMKMNNNATKVIFTLSLVVYLYFVYCLYFLTEPLPTYIGGAIGENEEEEGSSVKNSIIAGAIGDNEEEEGSSVKHSKMCLSFEQDVDQLVSDAEQIYITMPDKCAGTAMKNFVNNCVENHADGMLRDNQVFLKGMLSHSMEMPTVIADHTDNEAHLLKVLQSAPTNSLVIYIYREESDREASAIRMVVEQHMCYKERTFEPAVPIRYEGQGRTCVIESESRFIESVIKPRFWEIGNGIYDTLTCKTHEAIEKEGPNMIMVHYKQVDRLQKVIAKYRCPDLTRVFKTNAASDKREAMIQLQTGERVSIKEWTDSKKGQFGFLHNVNINEYEPKCRAKTRMMEKEMLGCEDEVIRVSG